jgi:multidrug efflux pump subunit AcrB
MPTKGTSVNRVVAKNSEKLSLFQRFGLFFYDRRETTLLFWLALLVFGGLSYATFMVRQGFPGVDVPVSVVAGPYFVGDRARVDKDVSKPFSETLKSVPEVDTVTAQADANFFSAVVRYDEGVSAAAGSAAVEQALQDRGNLPKELHLEFRPINAAKFVEQSDLLVAVYGVGGVSPQNLQQRAKGVADKIAAQDTVASTHVIEQFKTGVNPATGKPATQQQSFDWYGEQSGDGTTFHRTVLIGVTAHAGGDALELSKDTEATLTAIDDDLEGIGTHIAADFAPDINRQISGLQRSLIEGLLAVLILCFLLISWRASLTSALSMITVLALTIAILYAIGYTLNTITLFALILSLGLIVDDTIIKVEAMDAAKLESRRKRDIVSLAAKRVSRASAAGTFTTMLAFAPMLFVGGVLGDFIRLLPITIIISLAMSLLVSLTIVPLLASGIILRGKPKESRNPILKLEKAISNGLARLLLVGKTSRVKGVIVGVLALSLAVGAIGASTIYFQKLKFDIFPNTKDSDTLSMTLRFPADITTGDASSIAAIANETLDKTLKDNLESVTYQSSGSATSATATIKLVHFDERDATSPELIQDLEKAFEGFRGTVVKISQVDAGPPADDMPFKVQIYAENQASSDRAAAAIAAFLRDREVERPNGTTANITAVEVANPAAVSRIDARRVVEVRAGYDAGDTSALVAATKDDIEQAFPASRLASFGLDEDALEFNFGAESQNQESFGAMLVAFPLLLLAMYVLMAVQFKSFLQPLLIFMAIPFSFFGVSLGLHLTDNPLSFFVLVGFFALIGIALNNTILLTDYANQAREDGKGRIDAMASAVKARFRPLIATSLTSVVALIPLALNDPFWESLSYTLIFGLLSSTFLVIVTFPYIYLGGEVLKIIGHRIWTRQLPAILQYPLDILVFPIRLVDFLLYIAFRR